MPRFLKRFVRLQAVNKGLLGGSRLWTAVWMASTAAALAKRLTADKPEVIFRSELKDNDSLVISSRDGAPVRLKR